MKKLASIVLLMLAFASLTYVVSRGISSYQKKENLQKHASGIVLYEQRCSTCHQSNGEGISGLYPPLQSSDYVVENKHRIINVLLQGLSGEIIVNGVRYNGVMHPVPGTDQEIADILNYISSEFGNGEMTFAKEEIAVLRELHSNHSSN